MIHVTCEWFTHLLMRYSFSIFVLKYICVLFVSKSYSCKEILISKTKKNGKKCICCSAKKIFFGFFSNKRKAINKMRQDFTPNKNQLRVWSKRERELFFLNQTNPSKTRIRKLNAMNEKHFFLNNSTNYHSITI